MKKNDFATFIVYIAMFAIALLVGFLVIKPLMDQYGSSVPLHPIIVMLLGLVAGVILNALLLVLGHVLGARLGHYKVTKAVVLGVGVRKVNGVNKFGFHAFDGLVGETKVVPEDVKNSSLGGYIFFPVLFLFVEVVACMIGIVVCQNQEASNPGLAGLHAFLVTILAVGGMIFLYDLFPAHIESITDGYLLVLLSKPANKEAYNNLLLAEAAADAGQPIPETPVYEEITDFTAELNLLTVYRHLTEGEPEKALPMLDPMFSEESGASKATQAYVKTLKLATLLEQDNREKGKKMYEELSDEDKRYIANIGNLTSLRAYLLIASFVEASDSECNYAIDKAEKMIKNCDPTFKDAEKSLLQYDVDLCRKAHPSWEFYKLPWEEKAEKGQGEDK